MAEPASNFFTRHLSSGERLGELLFGLIMTLTFTLTAGFVVGSDRDAVRELLVATIGCNIAWGIIDGGLLVLGRLFDRGRFSRIGKAVRIAPDEAGAMAAVAAEMDEYLGEVAPATSRETLYRDIVRKVRSSEPRSWGVEREDWLAAIGAFWLVVFASIPAALPFAFIDEPWRAIRVSNLILLALFFVIGWRWATYTTVRPWHAAVALTAFGTAMVAAAIALGG